MIEIERLMERLTTSMLHKDDTYIFIPLYVIIEAKYIFYVNSFYN